MNLLSPWTAVIAGALSVPLLLLLYFLKLRRQERSVSSTLLWKRAVHDLQVNAPFQKLRKNLLLLLQLLVLAAVLFGLANPIANFLERPRENVVIVIDRSASMSSVESDGRTRLEHARDAARDYVLSLPDGASAMVISFADRAGLECAFSKNKRRVLSSIDGIEPTDAVSNIGEALQLAVAYSSQLVEDTSQTTPTAAQVGNAEIRLFSDGRLADAADQPVVRGELKYYRVGETRDNVGIVEFDVRRELEHPGMLSAFVQVENFGPEPITTDVSMWLNGSMKAVEETTLGAAASPASSRPASGGDIVNRESATHIVFPFQHTAGGTVEIRVSRKDALAADNVARAPIDPPRQVHVLGVSDRGPFRRILGRALKALHLEKVDWMTTGEYENAAEDAIVIDGGGRARHDLVIFDKHDTNRLPPGNYVFFGGLPEIAGVSRGEVIDDQYIVTWRENHPLIRPAELDNIYIARWHRLTLPDHATVLVEGEDSPILAFLTDPGHRYLIAAFDLLDSDLALKIPFIVILQNTVRFLTSGGLQESGRLISPGDTITVPVPAGAEEVRVLRPDGPPQTLDVQDRHTLTYARTHGAGIYRFLFDDINNSTDVYAANTLSAIESYIEPAPKVTLAETGVEAIVGESQVNRPLWPYAAAAALVILLLEWWIYNRRVMI